jgi:prophage regulatory protein
MQFTTCRLLRRPDVLAATGKTSSFLDREIRDGLFPPPVKLSPDPTRRAVGWPSDEVEAVTAAVIAGAGADEVRALVADLIARRRRAREAA